MVFGTTIKGKVIDDKTSSKGTRYLKVYNGSNLVNVFVDKGSPYNVGDNVEIECMVFTKDVYIREFVEQWWLFMECIDYTGQLVEIIENQQELMLLMQNILNYVNFISQPVWFITVVIIPLYFIIKFLWWFMRQFIQKY